MPTVNALWRVLPSDARRRRPLLAALFAALFLLASLAPAFLTAYWKPVERTLGWLLIPLGQATLYVFILHVVLIAVIANVPALQQGES